MFRSALTIIREYVQLHGEVTEKLVFLSCTLECIYIYIVSRRHRPHLPLRRYAWYSFLLEAESTSVTQLVIEPASLRVVVHSLLHIYIYIYKWAG